MGKRPGAGRLWLLLAPAAYCAGSRLAANLATAGALALSGLGLALTALAAGAMTVIRRQRASAAGRERRERR